MAAQTVYGVINEQTNYDDVKCEKCGIETSKVKLFKTREAAEQYMFELYGDDTVDGKWCCGFCPAYSEAWVIELPIN